MPRNLVCQLATLATLLALSAAAGRADPGDERHWAFVKPERPRPPAVERAEWVRNAIDSFVFHRLEQEQLAPSPEADREALVRRVTLDLTGLPPTLDEIDAFLADDSPVAYQRLVERLLHSSRWGEHQARYWLDAARYGDTHGLHLDNERSIWPYRRWVIDAFNRNMPFDQFTIEQLAGDLLPRPTLDQLVATGFNRCNVTTGEGGSIDEEYLVRYAVERVETTATVWLGLTVGCAACHDHKYDPISQKEFYRFYAYFNSLTEKAMDGNIAVPPPVIKVPSSDQAARLAELETQIAALRRQMDRPLAESDEAQAEWERRWAERLGAQWQVLVPQRFTSTGGSTFRKLEDDSLLAEGANPDTDVYEIVFRAEVKGVTAVRLEALRHKSLPGGGPGRADNANFVLTEIEGEVVSRSDPEQIADLAFKGAFADFAQADFPVAAAVDEILDMERGWAIDGGQGADRTAVLILEEPLDLSDDSELVIRLRHSSKFPRHAIGRLRIAVTRDVGLPGESESSLEGILQHASALLTPPDERTADERQQLRSFYRRQHLPQWKGWEEELHALVEQEKALDEEIPRTLVMEEKPEPRAAFLLLRGEYDQPAEEVQRGVPAVLPPLADDLPDSRLGLARWLVDPEHPLTARVTVNRIWQQYFGVGLVRTPEDFGTRGERPTHPDLLDWLATELVASGWDLKHLHRLIVTSHTYRQSSRATAELLRRDPDNRLLARGPRFRMDAEMVRDTALSVSGLLVERVGGPSVKPYQPEGLWEVVGYVGSNTANFKQDEGEALYRRSMYTFWKRTSPPPSLTAFDAPSREVCTVARPRTNTPMQALALMNDVQFVEAARHLAARMMREGGATPRERLQFGFRLSTSRQPDEREVELLYELFRAQLAAYQADEQAADSLTGVGDSPRQAALDPIELAAWTVVANLILNLDETVTKG